MEEFKTKYPVVLVHGMVIKDFKFYRAFRRIRNVLMHKNVCFYVTNQDGVGTVENNAFQLKEEILNILKKEGAEKVNIIAHSKGGLDSRYMIHELNMDKYVASLTTLSTPHHGSKTSENVLKMPKFFASILALFINLLYRIFGDKKPDILTLAHELKEDEMIKFNMKILNSEKVYYQSYSSNIDKKYSFIMFIPYKITKYFEKDYTDGVVSVSSSRWGNYNGDMDEAYSHTEMIGVFASKKKIENVSNFYLSIINDLKEKGF